MVSLLGLLAGLALLIWMALRGVELLIAAPLCALLVAVASGFAPFPQLAAEGAPSFTGAYMTGFVGFVQTWFFMFLLGSVFGKVMEATGAADSISRWIIGRLGRKHAAGAVVLACAVLTYGGVSLFVVAFSVYPMALAMFREANLPRRFIPGTIGFGSVTFTMTSAGSPEIQNWIPIKYLGTTPYAGWEVSLVVAAFMMVAGYLFLQRNLRVAVAGGETFVARADDPRNDAKDLPSPLASLLPIAVVLVASALLHKPLAESALIVALGAGVLAGMALNWRFMRGKVGQAMALGALGALVAIANTAAVVGFGGVAKLTPGFQAAVAYFTSLPGPPLLGAAIAVTLIAAMTGSASGGQTIALPILAPHYLDAGVNPEALHRVVAIASGGLDAMPHNGYIVTTLRAICKETYADAYPTMFHLTATVPTIGMFLAVVLFSL
jgi:H+/gluconate symporter-like permease